MNKDLFAVALRNVARNRRRTVLNAIALTVGMSIIIAALGWMRGYFTTLYDGMIRLDTGHVQVLHSDYLDEERRLPLDLVVADYARLRARLAGEAGVEQASGRIHYELELGNGREYAPMRGRAMDFRFESDITTLQDFIVDGSYSSEGVLLGRTAADLLDVDVGDTLFLRVRDRYGAPNTVALPLVGVFRTGYPLFDRYLTVTDLGTTSQFLRLEDGVTHLALSLESGRDPARAAAALQADLPERVQAYSWRRFAQTMIAAVEADIGAFVLLMGILFLLILLGILNSMSMAVHERGREIGTMRAIGLKRRELRRLLIVESSGIALLSAAAAVVVGGAFAAYVQFVGFDIAQFMPPDLPIPFGDRFYGDYRWYDFLVAAAFGVVSALLGTVLPARRATRMEVAETLRGLR